MLRVNETSSPPGGNRATPLGQTNASDSAGGNRATPLGQTTAPDSAGVHIFSCQTNCVSFALFSKVFRTKQVFLFVMLFGTVPTKQAVISIQAGCEFVAGNSSHLLRSKGLPML